jgi:hypothetical protein
LFDVSFSNLFLGLVEWIIVNSPRYLYRLNYAVNKGLVLHGFSSELSEIAVLELNVCCKLARVKMDVLNCAEYTEMLVQQSHNVLRGQAMLVLIRAKVDIRYAQSIAFFVK